MAARDPDTETLVEPERQNEQTTFLLADVDAEAIADDCYDNPTRIYNPFITHMITNPAKQGWDARNMMGNIPMTTRVWCFNRFGQTQTHVPGLNSNTIPDDDDAPGDESYRTIYIGGEHEDFYDPDFVIYNDVVVVHGDETAARPNDIAVYGYPDDEFLPTDFHTATYYREPAQRGDNGGTPERDYIYIIGGLGYPGSDHRKETVTQRLDLQDYSVERVHTTGDVPPPHRHAKARLENNDMIVVTWGKEEEHRYGLHIPDLRWEKLSRVSS